MQKLINLILVGLILISDFYIFTLVKENNNKSAVFDEIYKTMKDHNEVITNLVEVYTIDVSNRGNIQENMQILNINQAQIVKAINSMKDNKSE